MNFDSIKILIIENIDIINFGVFGEGISSEWITKAENRLGIKFPPSYVWWLKNYGGGEINGDEIFSVYGIDFDKVVGGDIVYMNELNRKNGFSNENQLVIQENDQGEMYYFDLLKSNREGEHPIYLDINEKKVADNFLKFLELKINERG